MTYSWKYDPETGAYIFYRDGEEFAHFNPYDNIDDYAEKTVSILEKEMKRLKDKISYIERMIDAQSPEHS